MPPKKAVANGVPAAKKRAAPKGANKLPPPLPEGEVLTDNFKKQWVLGKPIGSGGFGLIYLAYPADKKGDPYVMKVEPHANGPLFCELHFYMRIAKPEMIENWKTSHKLKTLGMPKYIASGSHQKGIRYRFMVMERFGTDLQKLFEANGKKFPTKTVYQMAIRLIDTLEYIHDNEYVHADIKASNLLQGCNPGALGQVYLVDYGLAFRYIAEGRHKEYKEDPRRTHDGTIEFTSRDAHRGVAPSRRGDLEILGYCLLQWMCSRLPWEDNLNNKEYVANKKIKFMDDIPGLMRACFPDGNAPAVLKHYLQNVVKIGYEDRPDYNYLRKLFRSALKEEGFTDDGKLVFESQPRKTAKAANTPKKRSRKFPSEDDEVSPPKVKRYNKKVLSPRSSEDDEIVSPPKSKRYNRKVVSPRSPSEDDEIVSPPKGKRIKKKVLSPGSSEDDDIVSPPKVKSYKRKVLSPRYPNSPTSPSPRTAAPRRVKSPLVSRPTPAMLAVKRAKANSAVVGSPAKPGRQKTGVARVKQSSNVATQTSPGLKGLKRSRKC